MFFAERGVAKVPGVRQDDARGADRALWRSSGAGTMGGGIAMACANAGLSVLLTDHDAGGDRPRHRDHPEELPDLGVSAAASSRNSSRSAWRASARRSTHDGFDDADLIIEAVFENMALKKELLRRARCAWPSRAACWPPIPPRSTSTHWRARRRGRATVIGLHFFSPANVMRLVEIVRGTHTAPTTVATALAFAKKLGKVGVVVGNGPGFVGNRMMFPYMYEAQFLVEDGASPEQVDKALTDFGMAMGIFAVDDMGGLDVAWRVRQELQQFSEPGARKPLVCEVLYEMGRWDRRPARAGTATATTASRPPIPT